MWPILYAFGTKFSRYLVLPVAAVIGTAGYYLERKFVPKRPTIEYLESSIQDQRAKRQSDSPDLKIKDIISPNTLNILKPAEDK
ncbi:unnamed protein product [Auanema sp. JU1783]|nr:unnamed protein product [Auanema sp. JU1783]